MKQAYKDPLRRQMNSRRSRKNFTLLELLVILAIIAILAALLLPSLSRAREMGKRMKCIGSIKQIGLCWLNYVGDSRGYIYPNTATGYSGWKSGNQSFAKLYNISDKAMMCPSGVTRSSYSASAHYSLNHDRLKNLDQALFYGHGILAKIQSPQKKLVFCDYGTDPNINTAYGTIGWSIPTINYVPGCGSYPPTAANLAAGGSLTQAVNKDFLNDFMNGRHLNSISVLYADGHAASVQTPQFAPQFYGNPSAQGTLFKAWSLP
ncbi:MAG: hypothetical protein A2X49_08980 [Lentisphaerae bacterium GWF2_52_8]|nr:MAG: hypothetical protein A2X49_08980 [Lentisphaerae bacterium GWF2_52_8]